MEKEIECFQEPIEIEKYDEDRNKKRGFPREDKEGGKYAPGECSGDYFEETYHLTHTITLPAFIQLFFDNLGIYQYNQRNEDLGDRNVLR